MSQSKDIPDIDYIVSGKRNNMIVDRYVTSDIALETILRNTTKPRHPVVESLLYIRECMSGKRLAKEAIDKAESAPFKGADPELLVLMLSSWAELSCHIGRPTDAEALMHRTEALIPESVHPEVLAFSKLVESTFADTTGNKEKCESILKQTLGILKSFSPRRKLYVWRLALLLAQQGRAIEMESEIKKLFWQCTEQFKLSRILIVKFIDAVETGNIKDGSDLLSQIMNTPHYLDDIGDVPFRKYHILLRLMHEGSERMVSTPFKWRESPNMVAWARTIYCLLANDTGKALSLARAEANKSLTSIFGTGFDSFNLIRAELAAGNHEAARRLLTMRQKRGNRHYLDDFFLTRIELLAENRKNASKHFANILLATEYYNAKGRLDFELRLSPELSQGDIVQLTSSAEKTREKETVKRKPVVKPPVLPDIRKTVREKAELAALSSEEQSLKEIIGNSTAIDSIRQAAKRFADVNSPLLITGDTGTGKELVARVIHEISKQKDHRFTAVNCGSITETLLESEMFGHERGAFTGAEKANKGLFEETGEGTIFLDEIGDISPRLQIGLLRVLETGEIRAVGSSKTRKIKCRIIAATNADLPTLTEDKLFRKDLLFRLQRLEIHIPPLEERREDILPMVRHFLDLGRRVGTHATLSKELQDTLLSYNWPGNVRELRNVIERMRLMHSDKLWYDLNDLDLKFQAVNIQPAKAEPVPPTEIEEPVAQAPIPTTEATPPPPATPAPPPITITEMLKQGKSQIRRVDILKELFAEHKKLTRSEVINILDVSPNTATKDLKALCDENYIERITPSASTRSHYFILKEEDA